MTTDLILVVEDEPSIAEVVGLYLRRSGYEVNFARDGLEAQNKIESRSPDLILMDLMLPIIDGFELTRWLRDQSDIPIIMLTARRDEVDRIAGLEMGADDYILKPFTTGSGKPRASCITPNQTTTRSGCGTDAES